MRIPFVVCLLATLAVAVGASQAGAGTAKVTFVNPEQFADFKASGPFGTQEREAMMADIRKFVEAEAARALPAGRSLEVRILDINDAGTIRPAGQLVRVSRDLSPAMVDLEYSLKDGGREVASGKEFVTGLAAPISHTTSQRETLPAIKDALRRWVEAVAMK